MYELPEPAFNSELVQLIFETERLRGNIGLGDTPTPIFADLKLLFDTVMSVVSAKCIGMS